MYRSRTHYTLSDLPMIPQARAAGCVALTALADLIYSLSSALALVSWRVESAAAALCPFRDEPEARTEVLPAFSSICWEGDSFADADTVVFLHSDPMADTAVAPALADRPQLATLADCRAAFCEPPAASPVPSTLASVATLDDCRESFLSPVVPNCSPVWNQAGEVYTARGERYPSSPLPSWLEIGASGEAQLAVETQPEATPVAEPMSEPVAVETQPAPIPAPSAAQTTRKPRRKKCFHCGHAKSLEEFPTHRKGKRVTTERICKACESELQSTEAPEPRGTIMKEVTIKRDDDGGFYWHRSEPGRPGLESDRSPSVSEALTDFIREEWDPEKETVIRIPERI